MSIVRVIRTDGREETHAIPPGVLLSTIQRLIGAEVCEVVSLRDGRVMLVDEASWDVSAQNPSATTVYWNAWRYARNHVCGDVVIANDEDFG